MSPRGSGRRHEEAARWWFRKETLLVALLRRDAAAGTTLRELLRAPAAPAAVPARASCPRGQLARPRRSVRRNTDVKTARGPCGGRRPAGCGPALGWERPGRSCGRPKACVSCPRRGRQGPRPDREPPGPPGAVPQPATCPAHGPATGTPLGTMAAARAWGGVCWAPG